MGGRSLAAKISLAVGTIVIGALCFVREGISFREVQAAEEPTPDQVEQELEALEVHSRQG